MTLAEAVARLRVMLQDVGTNVRWTDDNLRDCINEARAAVVLARPDSLSLEQVHTCQPTARQPLPDTIHRLLEVVDNTVSGRMVTSISCSTMDNNLPNWRTETGEEVEHFIYCDDNHRRFYVYPIPPEGHEITLLVNPVINPLTDLDVLELKGIWINPLLLYAASRAFDMDAEVPSSNSLSAQYRATVQQ